jgi:anti-sigma factor RsiW
MTNETHLTEDERHMLADGSLDTEHLAAAEAHVRTCAACLADVNRIRALLARADDAVGQARPAAAGIEDLWPSIRARIEQQKVVAMPTGPANVVRRPARRWVIAIGGVAAAALAAFWLVRSRSRPVEAPAEIATVTVAPDTGISLTAVADSTHAYQEEAQALLDHLELQRATMRPELKRAFESDLHTIDVAIAELQAAIAHDPNNPALRRLLASSYRQKVDLLKRVNDAT